MLRGHELSSSTSIPAPSTTLQRLNPNTFLIYSNTLHSSSNTCRHTRLYQWIRSKMKPIDNEKRPVVIRTMSHDEEGKKRVGKREVDTKNVDAIKYVEKKLMDKGVLRMDRHPVDGRGGICRPPPKSGHGGKFTWEGPEPEAENELDAVPPAIDEKDPNYIDEEEEERIVRGEERDVDGLVVGEVEVAKAVEAREGVARIEVDAPSTLDR